MSKEIYLLLADGTVYRGKSFGAEGESLGELVFTTGMVGYLETLTDPCYEGQIVLQTFPLIGNYGVIPADLESEEPRLSGYIVREWCETPSNFRSEGDLDTFLREKGVVGVYDIDTRSLTRKLRSDGVMNGMITASLDDKEAKLAKLKSAPPPKATATEQGQTVSRPAEVRYKVALWDLGARHDFIPALQDRGCEVITVPATTTAAEIAGLNVDGLLLGDGAGDPAANGELITEVAKWLEETVPTCGVGLGHQVMALARGGKTEKLKYGHRGGNQPAREADTGKILITTQNHGYVVVKDALPAAAELSYENVNDGTCEGLRYQDRPAFSVQFRPEGAVFDAFLTMIATAKGGNDHAAK